MTSIETVRAYIAAVETFDEAAAFALLHPQMRFHELPNRIRPKGGVDDLEAMRAGFRRAAEGTVLRAQRYILGEVIDAGDRVVVEARWEGDLVVPVGKLQPGDQLVAHLCMVVRLEGGLIIEQRNYDCYEDFTAA
ncbi:nuclear transport factor 2 family protein [Devosia oryziradicis]|uniref:Nuclear transport factor 2 family protein n=1 Tax=Devosia oryziradicis TaxID=2801335 RepID=A0ABX7C0T9_9HYPH|nr:nuclear transport factor 2 family protein [Devosia oryziradicis]QQR37671.1 nuclear transport factor 2 family protein [Devosia oryziradicis]